MCGKLVSWLVVLGLMTLRDSSSVYIEPSLRYKENEKRGYRAEKKSIHPPPAPTISMVGPFPTVMVCSKYKNLNKMLKIQ